MPGPVSDSYDPEFGTGHNAYLVRKALQDMSAEITAKLGPELHDILDVVNGPPGKPFALTLPERKLRIIRFALNYAVDVI
ncbi:MAG: hypothetical protein P4L84_36065 [Isosphaeraceae bacterium]|nr:hypothetical protein [Isosphaeraceae bacterium]